ncbi:helix-turn-helix transcriptional regulator [Nitrospirillum sp. BR 11164]|uniref:helix-turn-helix domain-containing protein n=1 Tax=Nitrospirillum sp. BR 11164 TaxID=3104324 RepID=UPI002AFE499D|nr:helix-turn-helix transcriptional regulator [Nitrospirillum sp. BR 11164]MEA1649250.1 helix-turn-helix transcriptional regulator [Nitrospirillum sp. BR 11164]
MNQSLASATAGSLLRHWRGARGKTQLDLSFDAGVSQKHISFVESGRSAPSRQMLLDLAQALDVPLRDRNTLLMAAGYAPVYAGDSLDDPGMAPVAKALGRMLRQQEPFPALVMDRRWTVQLTNEAAPRFFSCFIDLAAWPKPRNLLHLMFDPAGLRPHLANWEEAAPSLIARVHREALGQVVDAGTRALLGQLMRYPGVDPAWRTPLPGGDLPLIPLTFTKGGTTLRYFSMVTTVGTPQTVAAQELRLECLFPADEATEDAHDAFVVAHARD